ACYASCALDSDPETTALEPSCIVEEEAQGQEPTPIPECAREGGTGDYLIDPETNDYAMPDDASNVCAALLVDPDGSQTSDLADDMSEECVAAGYNLEFEVARRPGFPAAGGTSVKATCKISTQPDLDCPGLGG
ncbi:MAG: VWA domain-containing protein, partial [Myxococcales bacterium]|nr:VWA domain-containing protein [Myxococcales bacterium]